MGDTRRSYDRIARLYAEQFENELDEKPFDREFLGRLAAGLPTGRRWSTSGAGPDR